MNILGATHAFLKGSAHLNRGDTRLPAHQDAAALQRGYTWVLHAGVRSYEVGHVQQPVGSKQVGEAAATIKRVGRKGDKEAHTCALVLQVAAAGSPLSLFWGSSLRLQRPARKGRPRGGASAWTPPLAARTPPSGDPPSSQWAPSFKLRPQLHLLGQASFYLQALCPSLIPDWCLCLSIKRSHPLPAPYWTPPEENLG